MGILNWRRPNRLSDIEVGYALGRLVPPVPAPTDTELAEVWFRENSTVRARHIVVLVPCGATPAHRDEMRRQAEAVHARAANGEDFVELARECTTEPGGKERGGDLGFFGRGRMVAQFEDVAFALEPGQISNVVTTPFGYHLIRVEDRRQPEMRDMAAFRTRFLDRAQQNAVREYIEQLKADACVEVQRDAEEWVRQFARQSSATVLKWRSRRSLVKYPGGRVTTGDMARVLRSSYNARHLAQIAIASDELLSRFLSDQCLGSLAWAAVQRSVNYPGATRSQWVGFHSGQIGTAPGAGLLWFADFFYSMKDAEEILKPVVLDMRVEYNDALSQGRVAKAIWIQVRGTLAFIYAAARMTPLGKAIACVLGVIKG